MAHASRKGGSWVSTTQPHIRHGGAWRTVSAAWIRHAGDWRQWWPDGPDLGGPYLFGAISSCGPNICRWNGSLWVSVGGGRNGSVGLAAVDDTGRVCCIGAFTSPSNIAIWDGSSWTQPAARTFSGSNTLVSTGSAFAYAPTGGTSSTAYIYNIDASYSERRYVENYSPPYYAYYTRIALDDASGDYAFGQFDSPEASDVYWDEDGIASGISSFPVAIDMRRNQDGLAYLTGYNSYPTSYVWSSAFDNTWTRVGTSTGFNDVVTITAAYGGKVAAYGNFTSVDGVLCSGLAEYTGGAWTAVGSGLSNVVAMAYYYSKLWILAGSPATSRKVYTWDGADLVEHSDWSGDNVGGLV